MTVYGRVADALESDPDEQRKRWATPGELAKALDPRRSRPRRST